NGRKGTKYYGSETLSAASLVTCGDFAVFTLFERDDHFHARLRTGGNRPTLWNRIRPRRSHFECQCDRNRQSNKTVTYGYDQRPGRLQLSATCRGQLYR